MADKSTKDKPPSVVGFSRLTLLDCLTTWIYLDNTRTRMRVLFYYGHLCFCIPRKLGEISRFAHSTRVVKHVSTTKTTHSTSILRLLAQHLLLQMHSMSITPECYSGILVKNTPSFRKGLGVGHICRFLRFSFSFTSLIPCPLPPRDEREKTERTTAQLPANKKCCLLIFAIAIGCLVLAAIPARNPRLSLSIIPNTIRGILAFPPPVVYLPVIWQNSRLFSFATVGCYALAVPPARFPRL